MRKRTAGGNCGKSGTHAEHTWCVPLLLAARMGSDGCASDSLMDGCDMNKGASARRFSGRDNFVASLVEQEVCSNAFGFVGSRYSTWTDTVKGVRLRAERPEGTTLSFEELWAEGVR